MVTPYNEQILMRYPAREYEDVSSWSDPNSQNDPRNKFLLDPRAVYTKTNKRLFLSLFDYPPAGPRGFWMSSTPQPLCYEPIAAPLILFTGKIKAIYSTFF